MPLVERYDELGGVAWWWQATDVSIGKAGTKRIILVDGEGCPPGRR